MESKSSSSLLSNHLFFFIKLFFSCLIFLTQLKLINSYSDFNSPFPPEATPTRSGYLTINSTTNSSIFYAFYEAQQAPTLSEIPKTPLLIWLQGGPGCSSMLANFNGIGPWRVRSDPITGRISLEPNQAAWNRKFGVVFLDNPIGTGFSIASSYDEIPRDQHTIAQHLFIALQSLMDQNPWFQCRPVYIAGQGYAGKYIFSLGYYISHKNPQLPEEERINLVGVAVGNGLTDPVNQVPTLAETAYFVGLIDERQRLKLRRAQKEVVRFVTRDRWKEATTARNVVLEMLENITGLPTLHDVTRKQAYNEPKLTERLLCSFAVKAALGVDPAMDFEPCSEAVKEALHEDGMKSVKHMVEYLLATNSCKILLYEGQRDLQDGSVSVEAWLRGIKWREGGREFQAKERKVWRVKGELAGYVRKWGPLGHVVIWDAGHFVAVDQPVNAQAMIEDWVLDQGMFHGPQKVQVPSVYGAPSSGVCNVRYSINTDTLRTRVDHVSESYSKE